MHSLSGNILLYSWLKIHGLNHIGIKDYKCITCCKWLSYTGDLQTHRLNRGVQHIYALPVRRNLFILVTWRLINSQYTEVKTIMHYLSEEILLQWWPEESLTTSKRSQRPLIHCLLGRILSYESLKDL